MYEIIGDMSSTKFRFSVVLLGLLCAACASGAQVPQDWIKYEDPTTGVSLSYPPDFAIEPAADTQIADGTGSFLLKQLRIRRNGEAALISVLKADNPALLLSLTTDRAVQTVTVGGKELKKFVMEGAGSPTGFVLQEEPPIVIAFSYLDDEAIINKVVESVSLIK